MTLAEFSRKGNRARWKDKTMDERAEHGRMMVSARWDKARKIKALTDKVNRVLKG